MATNENPASILGAAMPRIDGPLKTSGTAKYSADFNLPRMAYAVPVIATIGKGKIVSMDTSRAQGMRGVVKVYDSKTLPKLYRPNPADHSAHVDEPRPPMEDDTVFYNGQYVGLVIGETLDQARAAAAAIHVQYAAEKPDVRTDLSEGLANDLHTNSERGNVDEAFAAAPVKVDQIYITPIETHNPIELHASVADWDGSSFTLYESTQSIVNHQQAMAQILGVPPENVRIVMKYLGSGFGGKLFPWGHSALAAASSRDLHRPIKFVVDRNMMFMTVGHRPRTVQRIKLGATPDGKITCISHDYTNDSSILDDRGENCGEATPVLWSSANLRVRSSIVHRNIGTPAPMRGPGAVPGLFALETAMDELAIALKMDPVQLRLLNDTLTDESNSKPFSSRHLKECLTRGANEFGWSKRTPGIGSMKRDGLVLGWGVAAASWGSGRGACESRVTFRDDGTVRVSCATQDIGTGTYTVFAQAVAAQADLPIEQITVVLGDSKLPPGPTSGGSMVTGTVLPSIGEATDAAMSQLLQIAASAKTGPFAGHSAKDLGFAKGRVYLKSGSPESGVPFEQVLRAANLRSASGDSKTAGTNKDPEADKYSMHSWGVHFAEVEYDPGIARLRVSRIVSVIDVGKIINLKAARNQMEGAMVMGVGMALFEETLYDHRTGCPVNSNLADYIVSTNADAPELNVTFLDYPDPIISKWGARGVGEIGLAGVAPAIASAVYHATGIRVRELPVRIEKLLAPMQEA